MDDTLIDTTGSVRPVVLQNALAEMQRVLPSLSFLDRSFKQLELLDRYYLNSTEAFEEFLAIHGIEEISWYQMGIELIKKGYLTSRVRLAKGVLPLLNDFAKTHFLALVTRGEKKWQLEKIKRSGLPLDLFRFCRFCLNESKKNSYSNLIEMLHITPSEVIVCGDRIDFDLAPAKALGCKTVHIRQGRGLGNTGLKSDVDYTILHLDELKNIMKIL